MFPAVSSGPLDPAWSPDGRWIAFSMRGDIWKVPAGRRRSDRAHVGSELLLRAGVESGRQARRAVDGRRRQSRDRHHRRRRRCGRARRVESARRSRADVESRRQQPLLRERAQRRLAHLPSRPRDEHRHRARERHSAVGLSRWQVDRVRAGRSARAGSRDAAVARRSRRGNRVSRQARVDARRRRTFSTSPRTRARTTFASSRRMAAIRSS